MAIVERERTSLITDEDGMRRLVAETNARVGILPGPALSAAEVRQMMLAEAVSTEDDEAVRERMRHEDDWEAEQMGEGAVARGAKKFFIDKGPIQELLRAQNERLGVSPDPAATPERSQRMTAEALRRSGLKPEDNIGSCSIVAARDGE